MNICLFTKTTLAHGTGGVEVHAETLCRKVPVLGHRLTLLATANPRGLYREERHGCAVHYLAGTRPARYSNAYWRAGVEKFLELHRGQPFDVVWSEDFAGFSYACELRPRLKVPLVSIMNGSTWTGRLRSEWARVDTLPELARFACKFLPEAVLFYRAWYQRTLEGSDQVIAISRETARDYRQEFHLPENKVTVVHHGVDTDFFRPDEEAGQRTRQAWSLKGSDRVILMAAVAHKQKGFHVGMEAFRRVRASLPEARLLVVGDGPHLAELKDLARSWGLAGDVRFCGRAGREEMPGHYNACDLFLNPTLREEGLALTTVEAMSCGKPSIVSRAGGTQSTVEEGVSGLFVERGDRDGIAQKTVELLNDPARRKAMGRAARDRAVSFFSEDKMVKDYLLLSESLLRRP